MRHRRGAARRPAPCSAESHVADTGTMTKSELIEALARRQTHLAFADVELAVKSVVEQMSQALSQGERIEVRGFGSFALHYRPPRMGRNPKTGESVALPGKHVPHFKPGKELRERVNQRLEEATAG
ncbi:MAG TPA: integration host factor subunit beta [Rhodanobacter sp.]